MIFLFYIPTESKVEMWAKGSLGKEWSENRSEWLTRSPTSVLVFFGAFVSSLSLSEISSLRPCLVTFGAEASSTRAFYERERKFLSSSSQPSTVTFCQTESSPHDTYTLSPSARSSCVKTWRQNTLAVCLDFSALPSLLDVLTPPGEARPLDLSSSRGPGASFFRPLLIDI